MVIKKNIQKTSFLFFKSLIVIFSFGNSFVSIKEVKQNFNFNNKDINVALDNSENNQEKLLNSYYQKNYKKQLFTSNRTKSFSFTSNVFQVSNCEVWDRKRDCNFETLEYKNNFEYAIPIQLVSTKNSFLNSKLFVKELNIDEKTFNYKQQNFNNKFWKMTDWSASKDNLNLSFKKLIYFDLAKNQNNNLQNKEFTVEPLNFFITRDYEWEDTQKIYERLTTKWFKDFVPEKKIGISNFSFSRHNNRMKEILKRTPFVFGNFGLEENFQGTGWYKWSKTLTFNKSSQNVRRYGVNFVNYFNNYVWKGASKAEIHSLIPLVVAEKKPYLLSRKSISKKDEDNDVIYVNYDDVVYLSKIVNLNQSKLLEFKIDPSVVLKDKSKVDSIFAISSKLNFFINYSENGKQKQTEAIDFKKLIDGFSFVIQNKSETVNLSNFWLDIQLKNSFKSNKIKGNWKFNIPLKSANEYLGKSNDEIIFYKPDQFIFNQQLKYDFFPSELFNFEKIKNFFSFYQKNKFLNHLSSKDDDIDLQIAANDLTGVASVQYKDLLTNEIKKINLENFQKIINPKFNYTFNINKTNSEIVQQKFPDAILKTIYFPNNNYWWSKVNIIPQEINDFENEIKYKIKIKNNLSNSFIQNQWEELYDNQIIVFKNSYQYAPEQIKKFIIKKPQQYSNNDIWNNLLKLPKFSKENSIDFSNYKIKLIPEEKKLKIEVQSNLPNTKGYKEYVFKYDQSQEKNNEKLNLNPQNNKDLENLNLKSNDKFNDPSNISQKNENKNNKLTSSDYRIWLIIIGGSLFMILIVFIGIKFLKNKKLIK